MHAPANDKQGMALDQYTQPSYLERFFDDISAQHSFEGQYHCKGRTLYNCVHGKHDKSIPCRVCKIFTDKCPACILRLKKKKPTAGHQPILTNNPYKRLWHAWSSQSD